MHYPHSRKAFLKTALLVHLGWMARPPQLLASALQTALPEALAEDVTYYDKNDPVYTTLRRGFNTRINTFPAVIALCKTTAGVAAAVQYARQRQLPIAIKSGGHCMEGFSGNDGGMVINLSLMKAIQWRSNQIVTIEPGCVLANVYETLLPRKRLIPGGSCGGVGIGGLTLGGGYGLLARQFGLTCDSLTDCTMVDGNGRIIRGSDDPNLLWACKGGGNGNFGIVTELTFATHPAPAAMQSLRFRAKGMTPAKARPVMEAWFEAAATLPDSCFSACIYNGRTTYILLTTTDKHWTGAERFIQRLRPLAGTLTKTPPRPLAQALKVFYGRPNPQQFKNASAGLYRSFQDLAGCIDEVLQVVQQSPGILYQVNTLGGRIMNEQAAAGSAFPHRAYPYFSELQAYWEVERQGQRLLPAFEKVQQLIAREGISAQYRNYPDINFTHPGVQYYGEHYPRLQQLKLQYDPENRIRHAQSVVAG
jgi:FAD binding domain/Berberine and berberine like